MTCVLCTVNLSTCVSNNRQTNTCVRIEERVCSIDAEDIALPGTDKHGAYPLRRRRKDARYTAE